MILFLTTVCLVFICTASAALAIDDLRFVPRHMLAALIIAIGVGLAVPSEDHPSGSQSFLGIMLAGWGVFIWRWLDVRAAQRDTPD